MIRVVLYDFGLAHRYYHATDSAEKTTRAVKADVATYGTEAADVIVCVDKRNEAGHYWRQRLDPAYKDRPRDPVKDAALKNVRAALAADGVRLASSPGNEADDVIATLCLRAPPEVECVVHTADHDMIQLAGKRVRVILHQGAANVDADADYCLRNYRVHPTRLADLLAIAGDAGDNVKGIPGIGLDGAADLLEMFASPEEAIAAAAAGKPLPPGFGKVKRELLAGGLDAMKLARRLVDLNDSEARAQGIPGIAAAMPRAMRMISAMRLRRMPA